MEKIIEDIFNNYEYDDEDFVITPHLQTIKQILLNKTSGLLDTFVGLQKTGVTMEELKIVLVAAIGEQLKSDKPNIQYLDVLNRLLGTVLNYILT